jgi:hypothetical protein
MQSVVLIEVELFVEGIDASSPAEAFRARVYPVSLSKRWVDVLSGESSRPAPPPAPWTPVRTARTVGYLDNFLLLVRDTIGYDGQGVNSQAHDVE